MLVPDGLVKDALEVALGQGRALEILVRPDLLGADESLVVRDRLHPLGTEALKGGLVFPKVELGADQDDGHVRCVVVDLWVPL